MQKILISELTSLHFGHAELRLLRAFAASEEISG
jgi:hypothetical protein